MSIFVASLIAQSRPAGSELQQLLDACRKQLGVRSHVQIKLSPKAASPAVCGLLRPVILLPAHLSQKLDMPQLRIVLLHELAHVKRGDLWMNLIQTLLQIAYFYNPLVWQANAAIRRVREQAVDEMVLTALGEKAQSYPTMLLDVARLSLARPALSLGLIGVVESKKALSQRIKQIMERPLPKTARLGALGLLAVLLGAMVLLPMAQGQQTAATDQTEIEGDAAKPPPKYVRDLPNGVTVELLGISYSPSRDRPWWKPDGSGIVEAPYEWVDATKRFDDQKRWYEIVFKLPDGLSEGSFVRIRHDRGWGSSGFIPRTGNKLLPDLRVYMIRLHVSNPTKTVRFGVAANTWRTVHRFSGVGAYEHEWLPIEVTDLTEQQAARLRREYGRMGRSVDGYEEGALVVTHPKVESATRVVVVDKSDRVHVIEGGGRIIHRDEVQINAFPIGVDRDEIKEYQLQVCEYEWAIFKNVSLQPSEEAQRFAVERRKARLDQKGDENATQRTRELIYVLRNSTMRTRTEEWTGAIKELAEIGPPAVPELVVELTHTERSYMQRAIAFALRAIGDPRAVPALIEALGESLWGGSAGGEVFAEELQAFMMKHTFMKLDKWWIFGPPVNEITAALEEITGHTEGHDASHHYDETGKKLTGSYEPTQGTRAATRRVRRQVADRWRDWWGKHSKTFVTDEQMRQFDRGVRALEQLRQRGDPIARAGVARFGQIFPTGEKVRLGPVRKLVLPASRYLDAKSHLDLDTGRTYAWGEGVAPENRYKYNKYYAQLGTDVIASGSGRYKGKRLSKLSVSDMHTWQIENSRWDSFEKELKRNEPLSLPPGPRSSLNPRDLESGEYQPLMRPATFLFFTREGGYGILQLIGPARDPRGTHFRYRLIEWPHRDGKKQPMGPVPFVPSEDEKGGRFGPIIRRSIRPATGESDSALDLDTGKLSVPHETMRYPPLSKKLMRWIDESGIDALALPYHERLRTLSTFNMKVMCVSNDLWNTITPAKLHELLSRRDPSGQTGMYVDGGSPESFPATFLFQTSAGTKGILQILDRVNEPPRHIDMRYKVLQ